MVPVPLKLLFITSILVVNGNGQEREITSKQILLNGNSSTSSAKGINSGAEEKAIDSSTEGEHYYSGDGEYKEPHKEHGRYEVFHIDFANVESAYVVSLWILIASIAKIGFHLYNKLSSIFPESCLLIVLGILVGIIVYFAFDKHPEGEYTLQANTFFLFLLPPIILDAGYFMPNRAFFNNIGTILLFAVVGTLWNTATIGLTLYAVSKAGWLSTNIEVLDCLVFSSLISAVDPVAVLAVFEEIHVNEQLHIVVFGESLLNDAVTVVLYRMFKAYRLQDVIEPIDVLAGFVQFFIVGIGGVVIGVLFGMACAFITKFTSHVRVIEPIFVFLSAYFAYLTSEMFHFSGIMALTFCGIVMKQYVIFNISEKSQTTIKYFLKMLSSMTETVIFMMLGTSTIKDDHNWDVIFIVLTIVCCLVYRSLGVLGLTFLANKQRLSKLTYVDQFVMAYGGLRGAIAFALAILLEKEHYLSTRNLFVTTTILVVMFTVFVQGITIKPLVNALKVRKQEKRTLTMNEQIHERLLDHTMAAIEDVTGYHGNHWLRDKWENFDNHYIKKFLLREKPKTAEHAIIRVHSKLSLRDAMEQIQSGASANSQSGIKDEKSLLRIIKNWSVSSFHSGEGSHTGSTHESGATLAHNDTVVDMQALDCHYSKKLADDSRTHHMLQQNLLGPRQRWTTHQRHTLNDVENHQPFHHNARLHLRHMISRHQHNLQEKKRRSAAHKQQVRMSKNVSFAHAADHRVKFEESPQEVQQVESTDSEEDDVILFTAPSVEEENTYDDIDNGGSVSPVALECQLPWKRTTGREGMPSQTSRLLPEECVPAPAEEPSWPSATECVSDNGNGSDQGKSAVDITTETH